jgi:hypothetical protein
MLLPAAKFRSLAVSADDMSNVVPRPIRVDETLAVARKVVSLPTADAKP